VTAGLFVDLALQVLPSLLADEGEARTMGELGLAGFDADLKGRAEVEVGELLEHRHMDVDLAASEVAIDPADENDLAVCK